MKILTAFTILILSASAFGADSSLHDQLVKIGEGAQVGNGGHELSTFAVQGFDEEKALGHNMKEMEKDYKKCGPYKSVDFRRQSIDLIESYAGDSDTAKALKELYDQKQIFKILSIQTNKNIECSTLRVYVYGIDGTLLKIDYGMND